MKIMAHPLAMGRDGRLILVLSGLFALGVNSINLGAKYISGAAYFLMSSCVSLLGFWLILMACIAMAGYFKRRFPSDHELVVRIPLMIFTFLVAVLLFLLALFNMFEAIPYFDYKFNETAFAWTYMALGILTVFMTLFREGTMRYHEWQSNCRETEKLHQAYNQSQLHALKSQVNPHFLFNSLNALSSLIQEDESKAEKFLDEMSKVYRYMLHNDEAQLVALETELKFVQSYTYLLHARYGDGLRVEVEVLDGDMARRLAPLTLQVIIENAFTQNEITKTNPLVILIQSDGKGNLRIEHNLKPKAVIREMDFEEGLDNLLRKYELLNQPLGVLEFGEKRVFTLPLMAQETMAAI